MEFDPYPQRPPVIGDFVKESTDSNWNLEKNDETETICF